MKTAEFYITVQISVVVEDDVSIEDAEKIALFNVEPITCGINSDLNDKLDYLEMGHYRVNSSEFVA